MKILAIGRPRAGTDPRRDILPHAAAEMTVLKALHDSGVVRESYSPGGPGSVLIMEADSRQQAQAALATLPLAASGVIDFELIELHPFKEVP